MRRYFTFLIVFFCIFMGLGCQNIKKRVEQKMSPKKDTIEKVESVELAQAILWPKPYEFTVVRDPFKPLREKVLPSKEVTGIDANFDLKLLGIVNIEGTVIVLIESPVKVSIFRKGDKIGDYTIQKTDTNSVILERITEKNSERIVLKMGNK